jgi:hypothetical protein
MLQQIKKRKQFWIWLVVFSVIWFALAWWMSGEGTRQSYQDICWANYGQSESYRLCMDGFNKQKAYYEKVKIGSACLGVVGLLLLGIVFTGEKNLNTVALTKGHKKHKTKSH